MSDDFYSNIGKECSHVVRTPNNVPYRLVYKIHQPHVSISAQRVDCSHSPTMPVARVKFPLSEVPLIEWHGTLGMGLVYAVISDALDRPWLEIE